MKRVSCISILLFSCLVSMAQTKKTTASGKDIYAKYCLTCHQQNGTGVPNLNPPLIKTSFVLGDKATLITWVHSGSAEEKVPIDGKYYNNNMPPQSFLKDEEMAAVLTYIRTNFGNKASVVTADDVKKVRAAIK